MLKKILVSVLLIAALVFTLASCIDNIKDDGKDSEPSEGLEFTLSEDETYYIVTSIGNCKDTDIVIPSEYNGLPVGKIGNTAFDSCQNIKSVVIPDSVTSIGDVPKTEEAKKTPKSGIVENEDEESASDPEDEGTKSPDSSDESENPPVKVDKIEVVIGNNLQFAPVTFLNPEGAFSHCGNLQSITLGKGLTSIGEYAFYECPKLFSITIPENVTVIGDRAFDYCYNLVEVINKSSLEITAGNDGYGQIAKLAMEVHTGESKIDTIDDFLFYTYDGKTQFIGYLGDKTDLTLPESYKGGSYEIRDYAYFSDKLEKLVIPDVIKEIRSGTLGCCYSLDTLVIGDGVTKIEEGALAVFSFISSITLGKNVETIEDQYAYISPAEIINNSSLDIEAGSDKHGGIAKYTLEVHTGKSKIDKQGDFIFYSHSGTNYLVKIRSNDWKTVLPDSYNGENYEIYKTASIDGISLTVGAGVTKIHDDVSGRPFEIINKSSLNIVAGSDEHGGIAKCALEVQTGESKTKEVGNWIFYEAADKNYLVAYTDPENPIVLPEDFNGENYEIADNAQITSFITTELTIPKGVTRIGNNTFYWFLSLKSIVIHDSLTSIGENSFSLALTPVKDVYYTGTEEQWNALTAGLNNALTGEKVTVHYNYKPQES